jgi:hypothetical protein
VVVLVRAGREVAQRVWSGRGLQMALALAAFLCPPLYADDPEPLHVRIDRAIEAAHAGTPAPPADDATFVRRLFLDLAGRIPSSAEARAFLDDPAGDKRAKLVDRLLASPEHARHMAVTFDVWLMERRADKHVKSDEWRAWLVAFFAANRPYNELARDVLGADGADPAVRPAAKFTLDRDVAPDALVRDVGRVFFGIDLQCAQCHDHPRIDDYLQRDYYGLYAFVARASLFQPDPKKPGVVAEKAEGDVAFKSVFTKAEGGTRPRIPDGAEIDEPSFPKGEEYQVKADPKDKTVRPVPKFSRRAQLARLAGEGAGRAFDRNIVNRLWAHMMGRGLVEPVDLHHSNNPPSHPELLEMLADAFAATKFDLRAFLRELALTRTYQRSVEMPATLAEQSKGAAAKIAALEAEAARLQEPATKAEEAARAASEEQDAAKKGVTAIAAELVKADAATADARKAHDASTVALAAAQKELAARQDLKKTVSEAAQKAAEAAARLSGDPELTAAAAIFQARAEKLGTDVTASEKGVAEKTAVVMAKAEPLAAAAKAADAVRVRLSDASARVKVLAGAFDAADAHRKTTKVAASHAGSRLSAAKALAEYGPLHAAALESREALKRIQSELSATREAAAKLPGELEARVAEAKKAHETALAASSAARKDLSAKEEALRAVSEAATKAEEVAQKAAKDAELVSAAGRVKGRRDALATESTEARKTAARLDDAARKAADGLAAAERARADLAGAKERIPVLEAALKPATEKAAADKSRLDEAYGKLTTIWTHAFAVGVLDPLTPEQIGWSMMQAAGVVDQQRTAAAAEFAKKPPPLPEAERARFVEDFVYAKLKGNEAPFVKVFGGAPGQPQDEFYATVDQALFLENGGLVRGWLVPGGGNLADRLMKLEDPAEQARELYLSLFSRRPTARETEDVVRYLARRPQARLSEIQEIAWAMLTSVEFRFKH